MSKKISSKMLVSVDKNDNIIRKKNK